MTVALRILPSRRSWALLLMILMHALCFAQNAVVPSSILMELGRLGVSTRGISWRISESNEQLTVYEGRHGASFFIIANKDYADYVECPILAFSNNHGFQGTESAWKQNIILSYTEQLSQLKEKGEKATIYHHTSQVFGDKKHEIKPLLRTTWGQDYPYNAHCPIVIAPYTRQLTGCVATAMSQLMYYYKYPAKGYGVFHSGDANGTYSIDFSKKAIAWDKLLPSYPTAPSGKREFNDIADLMNTNARAVSSHFQSNATSANLLAARSILTNHWSYSTSCKFIKDIKIDVAASLIYDNLSSKMPVIISGGSHAFICDGYKDGFYHLNLGWQGAADGYYKLLISNNINERTVKHHVIKEILCDITPDTQPNVVHRAFHVEKAGTLYSIIPDTEKRRINSLKLTGTLNEDDIALLRMMMGATDAWKTESVIRGAVNWTGVLQYLDLSEVKFVSSKTKPFLRIRVGEGSLSWGNRTFLLDGTANKDFTDMMKTPLGHGRGYRYNAYNNMSCLEFFIVPNAIAPMMFYDCMNLKEILLPQKTKAVMSYAFQMCGSMETINLPKATQQIESAAFADCYLLREVIVSQEPTEVYRALFPYKTEGKYGDTKGDLHQGIFTGNNIHTCRGIMLNGNILPSVKYEKKY